MKTNDSYRSINVVDQQSKDLLRGGSFNWSTSQSDVWGIINSKIDSLPESRTIHLNFRLIAAASILLILGAGFFLRFYSTTITIPSGYHDLAELPDGSTVELNAESTIKYYPLWWYFDRIVEFEGEGYFEVQKGNKFTVRSSLGNTQVLGTSFNIYSRKNDYTVTCLTGSVKVSSLNDENVILKPNSKIEINKDGKFNFINSIDTFQEVSWRQNIFLFTATPLENVFEEIERQFDISIKINAHSEDLYTGNFSKDQNVENILGYVCPPLGLKFVKESNNSYIVSKE